MKPFTEERLFVTLSLSSFILFCLLLVMSLWLELYEKIPAFGFAGYGIVIINVLWALSHAWKPWHYIVASLFLVLFGTLGSLDIILSKDEMLDNLLVMHQGWVGHTGLRVETLDDYVEVLIILLNVFTSALAGNALFYGLNRRNFRGRE